MRNKFQYTAPIKVIRTLWGGVQKIWEEIPESPTFDDELVCVWGEENEKKLIERGYKTVRMSYTITDPEFSTIYDHFAHKLDALRYADKAYGEYLFLDWDTIFIKDPDQKFWDLVRSKPLQCPLYGYPSDYEKKILEHIKNNPQKEWIRNLDPTTYSWVSVQNRLLEKYNWPMEDLQLLPNFCFFYSRFTNCASSLFEIYKRGEIKTCIEEFSMFVYSDCSLDDFIERYEPYVIRGRENDCYHFDLEEDDTMRRVNDYIGEKIEKTIYLKHI